MWKSFPGKKLIFSHFPLELKLKKSKLTQNPPPDIVSTSLSKGASIHKSGLLFSFGGNMACFLIPLGEALVLTVAKKMAFKKNADSVIKARLGNLEKMLYGGSFLLAIEHIYHGEVVLYPPFLTAMKNPEDIPEMLHEMATVGVSMAVVVTAVWALAEVIAHFINKKQENSSLQGASLCV